MGKFTKYVIGNKSYAVHTGINSDELKKIPVTIQKEGVFNKSRSGIPLNI